MNICFFNTLKIWGGGEKFYFDYALGFQKKGHHVFIVCSKNSVLSQKATAKRKYNYRFQLVIERKSYNNKKDGFEVSTKFDARISKYTYIAVHN